MYRIGEFSRITRIPVKTLHHYDAIGLLRPERLAENGYRLYSPSQVAQARIILRLRDLGCGLHDISRVLSGRLTLEELLTLHAGRLREQAGRLGKLAAVTEHWLTEVSETVPAHPIERIVRSPLRMASIRQRLDLREVGTTFRRLQALLEERAAVPCGPPSMLFFGEEYAPADADVAVCYPVERPPKGLGELELPAATVLRTIHRGPYEEIGFAYQALFDAAREGGHRTEGPLREIFLLSPLQNAQPTEFLTEIQIPVTALPATTGPCRREGRS